MSRLPDVTEDSLRQLRAFVADQMTLTLATIGPDGEPQAADLYYAETDDLMLYFVSAADSRHASNLARDPRVAATIHADSTRSVPVPSRSRGWRDIRGVQLEGSCVRVTGAERAKAWARYAAKFPFVLTDAALARALQKVDLYRITPHWLRWIDNTIALGHNQEWVMADGGWRIADGGWLMADG